MRAIFAALAMAAGFAPAAAPAQPAPPASRLEVPPPRVEAVPDQAPAIGFGDDPLDRAIRVIPNVESRQETVVDGKRTVRVRTRWGGEYLLTEEDGVTVTTVLQPETQRLRVPSWIVFEW